MDTLTFSDDLLSRKPATGIDVDTTLAHFAIITYLLEPEAARQQIHPRFDLDLIEIDDREWALLSVVPFVDQDFRFTKAPWLKWRFGQTNYRMYVTDSETGEHAAWFFGTSLDSWCVSLPRHVWKLPWHRANIEFECEFDAQAQRYTRYHMKTTNSWADAQVELTDTGKPPTELMGFDDLESGLVLLTHPRMGFYYRQDGRLGSYSIWHDRLKPSVGNVQTARFDLLDGLGMVQRGDVLNVHSVLIQHQTE
ncbi:MAG: DUF2071 domain-containing protein, partial [Gimesia sp.]|nr:DUF2071 domain-containing protein [Gimesia sp.]